VASLSSGLLSGQFHVIQPVDPKTAARLNEAPGVQVLSVPGGSNVTMPMHADKAPFNDVDFRQAMKYAVDRQEMIDKIFFGHASLANDHPVAPFDPFFNADIPQRSYEPDRAKFHLRKAGYDGEEIVIHASDAAFPGALGAGSLYAENAKRAGVNLSVKREPIDGYWSDVWSKVPFCYCYWGARPTPDLILSLAYICGAAWGDTNWCDDQFTQLVAAARVELDHAKRRQMYGDAQMILHERGATVVPVFQNLVHGVRDEIDTGGAVLGAQPFDTFRMFEKWSFKA
jgi:peptide/nickel transport system substrate-binding protein